MTRNEQQRAGFKDGAHTEKEDTILIPHLRVSQQVLPCSDQPSAAPRLSASYIRQSAAVQSFHSISQFEFSTVFCPLLHPFVSSHPFLSLLPFH